jgi:hypothetical protein
VVVACDPARVDCTARVEQQSAQRSYTKRRFHTKSSFVTALLSRQQQQHP